MINTHLNYESFNLVVIVPHSEQMTQITNNMDVGSKHLEKEGQIKTSSKTDITTIKF